MSPVTFAREVHKEWQKYLVLNPPLYLYLLCIGVNKVYMYNRYRNKNLKSLFCYYKPIANKTKKLNISKKLELIKYN